MNRLNNRGEFLGARGRRFGKKWIEGKVSKVAVEKPIKMEHVVEWLKEDLKINVMG